MKKLLLLVLATGLISYTPHAADDAEVRAWTERANAIDIVRDDWGIAHVHGKTDADAVFGAIYAQAEDDFNRVETNFLNSMGRLAESEGEAEIYRDLRMKLFIDPVEMKALYEKSPAAMKALMTAWADGLNFYLYRHPQVKPHVITRFEPWMALTFSEGSIGGDIERVRLPELEAFYGKGSKAATQASAAAPALRRDRRAPLENGLAYPQEPTGSNGFAVAPSNTASKHALLWINPHTSFFFRSELQMTSDEGLNAYGASTWGQFFIYQGFNERTGWMHTSSGVDNIDEYLETVIKKGNDVFYKYGTEERPMTVKKITVPYKSGSGMARKEFITYRTHHGPVIREVNGKWVSIRLMEDPLKALTQSWTRTKARSYKEFRDTMELHTNSSNNTIFASADGDIAYFHSNFIPKRDPKFDWTKPVDGSDPATEWNGILSIEQTPGLLNPPNGWLYNTNNWPWSAAGENSPKQANYPKYVERNSENPRGIHAIKVLDKKKDFTIDSLIAAGYDSYLPEFDVLLPTLFKAYDQLEAANPAKAKLAEPIELLRKWDRRWSLSSVPTSLAVYWGDALWRQFTAEARRTGISEYIYIEQRATPDQRIKALVTATDKLTADFGSWKTPWGEINRFQRLTDDIVHPYNDAGPSIPVAFTSSRWGSLASFAPRTTPPARTKHIFGYSGNSFIAAVEFAPDRVRARAVSAGGESGDPKSKHFNDQAARYATGNLREVYFYPDQLKGHTERRYHPGE